MSGTTANIQISVTSTGARVVQRDLASIGESADKSAVSVHHLQEMLAAIGIGLALHEVVRSIDEMTNAMNRLIALGTPLNDIEAVYRRIIDISMESHQSLQTTANLYQRMFQGLSSLGYSENEILTFTREISAAFATSGASSFELKYAIQDLAHGIAAGSLNARELNGIMRETPTFAILMAKALGIPISQLKEMSKGGHIAADALVQGFKRIHDDVMKPLENRLITFENAIQDIRTAFIDLLGGEANQSGALRTLTGLMELLAHNMKDVVNTLTILGAGFAVFIGVPAIFRAIVGSILALNAAMLANPILFFGSLFAMAATALYLYRNEIKLGIDETTTLGDLMTAIWNRTKPKIDDTVQSLSEMISKAKEAGKSMTEALVTKGPEAGSSLPTAGDFSAFGWVASAAKAMDMIYAIVTNGWDLITASVKAGALAAATAIVGMVDMIAHAMAAVVNGFIAAENGIAGLLHLSGEPFKKLEFDLTKPFADAAGNATQQGVKALENFQKGVEAARLGKGKLAQGLLDTIPDAQELARKRALETKPPTTLDVHPARQAPHEAGDKHLGDKLAALENKWDHVLKAVNEYAKAVDLIEKSVHAGLISREKGDEFLGFMKDEIRDKALGNYDAALKAAAKYKVEVHDLNGFLKEGIITQEEYAHAMEVAAARSKDQIDPLGAVTREIQRQIDVGKLLPDQIEVENKLHTEEQALMAKGILIRDQETQKLNEQGVALKKLIELGVQEAKTTALRSQMYQQIVGPKDNLVHGTEALNGMLKEGTISAGEYDKAMTELQYNALRNSNDLGDGFKRGLLKFGEGAQDLASGAEKVVTDAFDGMNSALINFVETGTTDFHKLAQSIFEDIAQMILKWLEWQAIKMALGAASGGATTPITGIATGGYFDVGRGNLMRGFAGGGGFPVGGNGGTDSQLVAFRASPNERVTVTRPDQDSRTAPQTMSAPSPQIKIVNSVDPRETLAHLSTHEGERLILNVIQRNPSAVKRAIG